MSSRSDAQCPRNRPPRVAHVITSLQTGGAETMLAKLVTGAAAHGGDSLVICLGADGPIGVRLRAAGIPTIVLGFARRWSAFRNLVALIRRLRQWRPSIIQGWMYHGNIAAWMFRMICARSAVLLWNVRCTLSDPADFPFLTRCVIRANAVLSAVPALMIFNSRTAVSHHRRHGFRPRASAVLVNGFDLEQFAPDAARRDILRATLGIAASDVLIGMIARYHPMKDFGTFIAAIGDVVSRGAPVRVVMAGPGVDNDNVELAEYLRGQGISQRVQLVGELADVATFLPALDVLCLSSAWGEAFPNVLGEAMACAVPCVATHVGDVREIIGDTGHVVEPRDSAALADALERMTSLTPTERQALGAAARQRVSSHYDIGFVVQEYMKIYSQCAHEERA